MASGQMCAIISSQKELDTTSKKTQESDSFHLLTQWFPNEAKKEGELPITKADLAELCALINGPIDHRYEQIYQTLYSLYFVGEIKKQSSFKTSNHHFIKIPSTF